jgi:hypothetical protein
MARVRANVVVKGKDFWALFDTGAGNTYVVEEVASLLPTFDLEKPESVALGGKVHQVKKDCRLTCLVEGLPIRVQARVLPEIGIDEKGKKIEILIGSLAMEEWGITPIPQEERLDMTHYPKEFTEFFEKVIAMTYEVKKEDVQRITETIIDDYGDALQVEEVEGGIKISGDKVNDWIVTRRIEGIIAKDDELRLFSDCFYLEEDFDKAIKDTLSQNFGDRYRVSRGEKPPTKFARGTWRLGGEHLFVTGDFKDYDEIAEMIKVVDEAIREVVKKNIEVVIEYQPGKKDVAQYVARVIEGTLKAPIKSELVQKKVE